jgi:hypothetical protein
MNFNHLGVVLIVYYKCMHFIIHFNLGVTQLFFHTFYLLLLFNIFIEVPIANSSINA